ncbi:hypothetical protein J8J14_18155 [Roseomonas sp. SSH11]|uniref:Uncharacterized protein n=1 Tax=Pararoseomonas baculiformis TaxID=2820812 RepID=A0ABS4AI88_9PROT|nr:hypothetical protein [Pararoseomonas baculiformis]MBP0446703.1 hypothetical protein [Pararoseomonas baculiformis]
MIKDERSKTPRMNARVIFLHDPHTGSVVLDAVVPHPDDPERVLFIFTQQSTVHTIPLVGSDYDVLSSRLPGETFGSAVLQTLPRGWPEKLTLRLGTPLTQEEQAAMSAPLLRMAAHGMVTLIGAPKPITPGPVFTAFDPLALGQWRFQVGQNVAVPVDGRGQEYGLVRAISPEDWAAIEATGARLLPRPSIPQPTAEPARQASVASLPRGLSYRSVDTPLVDEMRRLIAEGRARGPQDAARMVVGRAVGAGSADSKVKRLARQLKQSE